MKVTYGQKRVQISVGTANLVAASEEPIDRRSELAGARIIIVLGILELGGAERQALLLARYLADEQRANVEIWGCTGKPGRVAELCEEYGIPWRIVPLQWSWNRYERFKGLAKFAYKLRRARPDVILPYITFTDVICGVVWRLTGARVCIWNHREATMVDRMGPRVERLATRQTPWFIANSQHGADFLTRTFMISPERIRVIHNGVELAPAQADRTTWRSQLKVSDECFLACMVANIHHLKDHATLLRAWKLVVDRLRAEGLSAVLLLAGRFDNTPDPLKVLAYDLELCQAVRFLGPVKDVSGLLGAVDLGVFSSHTEGCPNGVLECMAAGLAIAGTDIPGIREAVGSDGYMFLAPPGNAEALAARILELASNPALRHKIGAANRHRIETEFNPRLMYGKTLSLIVTGLEESSRSQK